MSNPHNVSSEAEAVVNAAWAEWDDSLPSSLQLMAPPVAAGIQAAVDEVISPVTPPIADFDEYAKGFAAAHVKYRQELLAITEELKKLS